MFCQLADGYLMDILFASSCHAQASAITTSKATLLRDAEEKKTEPCAGTCRHIPAGAYFKECLEVGLTFLCCLLGVLGRCVGQLALLLGAQYSARSYGRRTSPLLARRYTSSLSDGSVRSRRAKSALALLDLCS